MFHSDVCVVWGEFVLESTAKGKRGSAVRLVALHAKEGSPLLHGSK